MVFLSRFEIAGWHLSSFAGNPYMPQKLCCSFRPLFRSPFLPGSWPCLSIKPLQLPEFAFCWPSLLPNGVSIAFRFWWMASFFLLQEALGFLKGSAAALDRSCYGFEPSTESALEPTLPRALV